MPFLTEAVFTALPGTEPSIMTSAWPQADPALAFPDEEKRMRILMDGTGKFVYWAGGPFLGSAEYHRLAPDDALIIYTRNSTNNLTWNISFPAEYGVPNKNINP